MNADSPEGPGLRLPKGSDSRLKVQGTRQNSQFEIISLCPMRSDPRKAGLWTGTNDRFARLSKNNLEKG
jgi:hypothetical protein